MKKSSLHLSLKNGENRRAAFRVVLNDEDRRGVTLRVGQQHALLYNLSATGCAFTWPATTFPSPVEAELSFTLENESEPQHIRFTLEQVSMRGGELVHTRITTIDHIAANLLGRLINQLQRNHIIASKPSTRR